MADAESIDTVHLLVGGASGDAATAGDARADDGVADGATDVLPSWRPGPARDRLTEFLDASVRVPVERRVAVFDNDGTLWCEKPDYVQMEFFLHVLRAAVERNPGLADRAEYRALLDGDGAGVVEVGIERVVFALIELTDGWSPDLFESRVRDYVATARHRDRGVPLAEMRYRPMLELIGALRARDFDVFVVTGGGTEFVRALSASFYGVSPEGVVGSQVGYAVERLEGRPGLRRTVGLFGDVNEGDAKIGNIQRQLGRRPIFAAGNSAGDAAMLDYAVAADGPTCAVLVDHDDADREYAYESRAMSFDSREAITDVARRSGWTVVSMRRDWSTVFP